ncbi:T9SS type A sorting domain-containing protein [candidate division WOR-3 bacterium]|nr:T9SS type A sorting domain-containing protein [candidate division WOR-3 bacterium]
MLIFLLSIAVSASDLHLRMNLFNKSVYSDNFYISTDDGGLLSFDPEDSSWNWVNSISGLPSNRTKDLFLRGDSVFVLSSGGISIFNKDLNFIKFQNFNPLFFTDTAPNCIYVHGNNVILGGENSIQWFDLNHFGNLSRVVEHENYNFGVFEILSSDTCYLLGTSRGVFRVDSDFKDTTLLDSSGETYSLFVTGYSIWAGGSWGCKEITGDSAVFSEDTVWSIKEIDEDIYIAAKNGLYRYEGDWKRIHGGDVRGVARVLPDNLRVSVVRGNGLLFVGPWSYIYPPGLVSNMVTDLVQTPDGKIYMSYKHTRRISVFDGISWQTFNNGNSWGLPGGYLFNMESDSEGRIYFGFWYSYQVPILFCWDTQNDTMPRPIDLPVSATTVTGMLIDSNDDLWVGLYRTSAYGLGNWVLKMHLVNEDSLEWTIYQDPEMVWKRVFAEGEEGVYCGNSPTDGGAGIHVLYDNGTFEEVVGELGSSTISMCADLKGNIWAGLEDKLVYISDNSVERVEISRRFEGLTVDFQGGLWCYNTTEGLSYRNPEGDWESLPQEVREIQPFSLKDIVSPLHFTENRNLFVCTYNGLYEFDLDFNIPDSGEIIVYPNPFNYEEHNQLTFSAKDLGDKDILIYDVIGDLKGEYEVPSGNNVFSIDIDLSSGLYLYFVTEEGKAIYKGKFVVVR